MLSRIWNILKSFLFGIGEEFIDANLSAEVEQEIRELKGILENSRDSSHEIEGKKEFISKVKLPELNTLLEDYKTTARGIKDKNPNDPLLLDISTDAVKVQNEIAVAQEELNSYTEISKELEVQIQELNHQISELESDLNAEKVRAKVSQTKKAIASTVRSDLTNARSKIKSMKEKNFIVASASDSKIKKDLNYQMNLNKRNNSASSFLDNL